MEIVTSINVYSVQLDACDQSATQLGSTHRRGRPSPIHWSVLIIAIAIALMPLRNGNNTVQLKLVLPKQAASTFGSIGSVLHLNTL